MLRRFFYLASLFSFLIFSACASGVQGTPSPTWIQKTSYVENGRIYAVGISVDTPSIEAGREEAFLQAKQEIRNFAQIHDISGVDIRTERAYQVRHMDRTFTVYRMVSVDLKALKEWKKAVLVATNPAAPPPPPPPSVVHHFPPFSIRDHARIVGWSGDKVIIKAGHRFFIANVGDIIGGVMVAKDERGYVGLVSTAWISQSLDKNPGQTKMRVPDAGEGPAPSDIRLESTSRFTVVLAYNGGKREVPLGGRVGHYAVVAIGRNAIILRDMKTMRDYTVGVPKSK